MNVEEYLFTLNVPPGLEEETVCLCWSRNTVSALSRSIFMIIGIKGCRWLNRSAAEESRLWMYVLEHRLAALLAQLKAEFFR
jgi:hypothetical protein